MKLGKTNQKGFTLIELMIVIAIIGILAAIAIPNFISYRDKAYCSSAESDAHNIANNIADYFAIPTNVSLANIAATNVVALPGNAPYTLSNNNTAVVNTVAGPPLTITIAVTDVSTRCPANYQAAVPGWVGGVFTKNM